MAAAETVSSIWSVGATLTYIQSSIRIVTIPFFLPALHSVQAGLVRLLFFCVAGLTLEFFLHWCCCFTCMIYIGRQYNFPLHLGLWGVLLVTRFPLAIISLRRLMHDVVLFPLLYAGVGFLHVFLPALCFVPAVQVWSMLRILLFSLFWPYDLLIFSLSWCVGDHMDRASSMHTGGVHYMALIPIFGIYTGWLHCWSLDGLETHRRCSFFSRHWWAFTTLERYSWYLASFIMLG